MSEFPETRESLLVQVQDPANRDAWDLFARIYRPAIVRIAMARGLQHADAQDLSQQVLMAVASAIGTWEKRDESTRFRHWLSRVTKNAILNALTRRPKDLAVGGSSIEELPSGGELESMTASPTGFDSNGVCQKETSQAPRSHPLPSGGELPVRSPSGDGRYLPCPDFFATKIQFDSSWYMLKISLLAATLILPINCNIKLWKHISVVEALVQSLGQAVL